MLKDIVLPCQGHLKLLFPQLDYRKPQWPSTPSPDALTLSLIKLDLLNPVTTKAEMTIGTHLKSLCQKSRSALILASCAAGAFLAVGCAAKAPSGGLVATGLNCIDDSAACIAHRQTALRILMNDRQRTWIHRPPTAEAYASGVRLFAYKKSKKALTCGELGIGIREASGARVSLRRAAARLSPAQIARSAMLGDEVSRELSRENKHRCKKG